jgi:hypothetical protein
VAKRRAVRPKEPEEEEEPQTAEERRSQRERDRRAKKTQGSRRRSLLAGRPKWQRAAVYVGVAVAVIAAIAVILLYIPHPCLALSAPPAQSGTPSESAWSWCVNSTDAIIEQMTVSLTITVGGTPVPIPGGIGNVPEGHYGGGTSAACTMPIYTLNATGTTAGQSGGYIEIASPWAFTYTLADFFSLWHDSYSTVTIGGSPEPVEYSGTQIFNYSDNTNSKGQPTQIVQLWVDGNRQNNSNGPETVLNYLADDLDTGAEQPQCLVSQYGSGHSIVITWGWVGAGEFTSGPTLFQAPGDASSAAPLPSLDHAVGPAPAGGAIPPALGAGGLGISAVVGASRERGPPR